MSKTKIKKFPLENQFLKLFNGFLLTITNIGNVNHINYKIAKRCKNLDKLSISQHYPQFFIQGSRATEVTVYNIDNKNTISKLRFARTQSINLYIYESKAIKTGFKKLFNRLKSQNPNLKNLEIKQQMNLGEIGDPLKISRHSETFNQMTTLSLPSLKVLEQINKYPNITTLDLKLNIGQSFSKIVNFQSAKHLISIKLLIINNVKKCWDLTLVFDMRFPDSIKYLSIDIHHIK